MINKENIRKILILGSSDSFEIPQECLEGYIELLDRAILQLRLGEVVDARQAHCLKIVTDKKEYFLPCEWIVDGKGIDLATHTDIFNYLESCEAWMWTEFGGYLTQYETSEWTKCHSLRKIWPALKQENIRRIIFCYPEGYIKTDEWVVDFEVPQNCLQDTVELLNKAICNPKTYIGGWNLGFLWMKVITDKGKYLTPLKGYENKIICGIDWVSSKLKEYLKKCGWADPNN
jgi:hypothetical protein